MPRKRLFKPGSKEEETILGVRITKEMRHQLKFLALRKKISMAELVREIIESFLKKHHKEMKALDSD